MIKELKYLSELEDHPDNELFEFQGDVYLKWNGNALPFITGDEDDEICI